MEIVSTVETSIRVLHGRILLIDQEGLEEEPDFEGGRLVETVYNGVILESEHFDCNAHVRMEEWDEEPPVPEAWDESQTETFYSSSGELTLSTMPADDGDSRPHLYLHATEANWRIRASARRSVEGEYDEESLEFEQERQFLLQFWPGNDAKAGGLKMPRPTPSRK